MQPVPAAGTCGRGAGCTVQRTMREGRCRPACVRAALLPLWLICCACAALCATDPQGQPAGRAAPSPAEDQVHLMMREHGPANDDDANDDDDDELQVPRHHGPASDPHCMMADAPVTSFPLCTYSFAVPRFLGNHVLACSFGFLPPLDDDDLSAYNPFQSLLASLFVHFLYTHRYINTL